MSCVTRFQVLRGTTSQRVAFTPLLGELVFDTSLNQMFVGDGTTPGGLPLQAAPVGQIIQIYNSNTALTNEDAAIGNSATAITFTLPDAMTADKKITVKNKGAGVLTVQGVLSQLIDSYTDIQLNQTNSVDLVPKNGEWFIC